MVQQSPAGGKVSLMILILAIVITAPVHTQDKKTERKVKTTVHHDHAVMETSMGVIELELFSDETPKTVKNFIGLANKGYYNGVIFHRVIDNFMIQAGDPSGTGMGGESIYGKKFEDEIIDTLKHAGPGILSMANAGPNTNGSQFFITLVPTPWLDGKHTVFGKIVKGMDVVRAIGKVPTSPGNNRPLKDVVITKVVMRRTGSGKK